MAKRLVINGKSRLSVCNAIDKVLLNKNIPELAEREKELIQALSDMGMTVIAKGNISKNHSDVENTVDDTIFYKEFLSAKILLAEVDSLEESIATINKYSGGHSAVIVSKDKNAAWEFQKKVDCAAVYHNASTRFTDGGEFGFGAEIAISTQKLHFRGPLGLAQLVTNKFYVYGTGQTRD